jgi:hypothetical protein
LQSIWTPFSQILTIPPLMLPSARLPSASTTPPGRWINVDAYRQLKTTPVVAVSLTVIPYRSNVKTLRTSRNSFPRSCMRYALELRF